MPEMRSYRDTPVWQTSVELAVQVYRLSGRFPAEERYGLTSQVRRAVVSVSSSIAEGWGRGSRRELANRLCIARGSLNEVESQLIIAHRLDYVAESDLGPLSGNMSNIGRQLTAWRISLLRSRGEMP